MPLFLMKFSFTEKLKSRLCEKESNKMKYIFDNDLHIHSGISLCSGDENQTPLKMLEYAKREGLKNICITDHFWDERVEGASDWYKKQPFSRIAASKPLPESDGINFYFGCETDLKWDMTLGISKERFDEFDFVIIPTTHMHMQNFVVREGENTPHYKAERWVSRLEGVLRMDLPFHKIGIAHLACPLIFRTPREDYIKTLDLIKEEDMVRVFKMAAEKGCGIEINNSDMSFDESEEKSVLRMFRIAKECGCKFYMGSDAHHPEVFEKVRTTFEKAIEKIGLTEEDKFIL